MWAQASLGNISLGQDFLRTGKVAREPRLAELQQEWCYIFVRRVLSDEGSKHVRAAWNRVSPADGRAQRQVSSSATPSSESRARLDGQEVASPRGATVVGSLMCTVPIFHRLQNTAGVVAPFKLGALTLFFFLPVLRRLTLDTAVRAGVAVRGRFRCRVAAHAARVTHLRACEPPSLPRRRASFRPAGKRPTTLDVLWVHVIPPLKRVRWPVLFLLVKMYGG